MDEPYWCPFGKSEGWMPPELDGNPWSKGRIKLELTAGKIRERTSKPEHSEVITSAPRGAHCSLGPVR